MGPTLRPGMDLMHVQSRHGAWHLWSHLAQALADTSAETKSRLWLRQETLSKATDTSQNLG